MNLAVSLGAALSVIAGSALSAPPPVKTTAPPQPAYVTVQIVDDQVRVPVPEGYCEPTGPYVGEAQVIAATDSSSITLLRLNSCAEMAAGEHVVHYAVLKAVKETLTQKASRADVLKELGSIPMSQMKQAIDALKPGVNQKARAALSPDVDIDMHMQPVDLDSAAYYVAGVLSVRAGDKSAQIANAVAFTSVKDHFVLYSFTIPGSTPQDVATVLGQAKTEVRRLEAAN